MYYNIVMIMRKGQKYEQQKGQSKNLKQRSN